MVASCGRVAQLGEHLLCKQGVTGSIPVTSTTFSLIAKDLRKSRRREKFRKEQVSLRFMTWPGAEEDALNPWDSGFPGFLVLGHPRGLRG